MNTIYAPFSPEQIVALNDYQNGPYHPFTCPNDGDEKHTQYEFSSRHPHEHYDQYIEKQKQEGVNFPEMEFKQTALVAHPEGWKCPCCDYTQNWAHDFMADSKGRKQHEDSLREKGFTWT